MGRGGGVSPTPRVSACSRPGLRCRIDFVHLGSRGWTKERAKLRKPVFKEICISVHVGIAEPLGIEMGTSTQVACTPRQLLCATHTFEPSPETLEVRWASKTLGDRPEMLVPNDEILRHFFAGAFLSRWFLSLRIGSWRLEARSPGRLKTPIRTCTYVLSCTIGGCYAEKLYGDLL